MSMTVTVLVDEHPDVTTQKVAFAIKTLLEGYKGVRRITVHKNTGGRADRERVSLQMPKD